MSLFYRQGISADPEEKNAAAPKYRQTNNKNENNSNYHAFEIVHPFATD